MSGPLKYLVIKNTIKEQLLSGVLKYGDKVPSEAELCEQYDVSRISAKEHWMNWHMKVILSGKEVVEAL